MVVSVVGTEAKAPWLLLLVLVLLNAIPGVSTVASSDCPFIDCWDSCVAFVAPVLLYVFPFEGSIVVELALSDIDIPGCCPFVMARSFSFRLVAAEPFTTVTPSKDGSSLAAAAFGERRC
jgi:hypothetical protein